MLYSQTTVLLKVVLDTITLLPPPPPPRHMDTHISLQVQKKMGEGVEGRGVEGRGVSCRQQMNLWHNILWSWDDSPCWRRKLAVVVGDVWRTVVKTNAQQISVHSSLCNSGHSPRESPSRWQRTPCQVDDWYSWGWSAQHQSILLGEKMVTTNPRQSHIMFRRDTGTSHRTFWLTNKVPCYTHGVIKNIKHLELCSEFQLSKEVNAVVIKSSVPWTPTGRNVLIKGVSPLEYYIIDWEVSSIQLSI